MIISTNYTPGYYVDLRRCCNPCSPCGCVSPCFPSCGGNCSCFPTCGNPCSYPQPCPQQNCCGNFNISIPCGAVYFMAGYLISKGMYK